MEKNHDKVRLLAKDLRDGKNFPRGPRETLADYVLAARVLDKCRSHIAGIAGDYHTNCPLDQRWLKFAEVNYDAYRAFVETGATDEEVAKWIGQNSKKRARAEIIQWNNRERDLRLSDLPAELQEFMEDYIAENVPKHRPVYHWYDVFDMEEGRM